MDGSNWKRVLLHWVNQLRFFGRTFYNLEQTDIEEFFTKFREHNTATPVNQDDLTLFLKEQYPEFELHLDDENQISAADYMYVYSLLLHFSCVKCPQEYFHKVCNSLQENYQQVIASFFREVLEKDGLNKTNLRQAIADASPNIPLQYIRLDSPIRTPRDKCLPPTPKTNMLEEKTREVNFIKAQLDTERYEKGLLEVQLRQQEEQIEKLNQTQKKYAAEMHQLRNELLVMSTESHSPNKNVHDEQIKKRLRKELAEKEEIILGLRENIYVLNEEKSLLSQKLSYTESQVITCLEKIKDMDCVVNDLKAEIENKDMKITFLTETKNDLEQFIEATRSPSGNQNDFNMSVECLDASRTTNSSGSISSPENLGCSVIDIQLKEKENENAALREEIDKLKCDQSKLSRHVCDLIVRYADVFEICDQNVVISNEEILPESFTVFDNYVNRLVDKYKLSMKNVNQLSQETLSLSNENRELKKRLSDVENILHTCEIQIEALEVDKSNFVKENNQMQNKYEACLLDIQNLNEDRKSILNAIENLKKDYHSLKVEKEVAEQNWSTQIEELTSNLSANRKEIDKIEGTNDALKDKICELLEDIDALEKKAELATIRQREAEEKNVCLEREQVNFAKMIEESKQQLTQQKEKEEKLKSRLEDMVTLHEKLEWGVLETKKHLEKVEGECRNKENQLLSLERQLIVLDEQNAHLNTQIIDLTAVNDSLENNHLKLQNEITSLKSDISKKENECENLKKQLNVINSQMQKMFLETEESSASHSKTLEAMNKHIKECETKIEDLSNKEQGLQKLLESAQNENSLLSATIEVNETHQKELASIIKELKEEKRSLEENNNHIKEDLEEKLQLLTKVSENFKSELCSLLENTEKGSFEQIMLALNHEYSNSPLNELQNKFVTVFKNNNILSLNNSELQNKIKQLEIRVEEIETAKDKLIEKLNYSQQQIEQLETENRDLEEDKCKYMNNVEDLTKNLNFLENGYERLSETNEKLEGIINSLEIELQSSCHDNMSLMSKIGELGADNETLTKKSKDLSDKLELIESQMDKLKVNSESAVLGLRDEIRILEADQKAKEADIILIRKQCEEKSDKIKILESQNVELVHKCEVQGETLKEKESYISCLENENVKLKLKLEELSKSLSQLEKNLTQKWQEALEKSKSLEHDLQSVNASKLELLTDLQKSENAAKSLSDELEASKSKIAALSTANSDLEVDIKVLFEKLKSTKKAIEDAELKHASMKAESKKVEDEKIKVVEQLKQTKEEAATLRDKILDMVTQVNSINIEKEEYMRRNRDLSDELRNVKSLYSQKQKEIDDLEDTHKKTIEQAKSLTEALAEAQKEISHQSANCKSIKEELRSVKAENTKLKESQQKLEEVSSGLNKRLEKVSIKLGDSQARASKLEKENEALKKNFETCTTLAENLQKENAKYSLESKTIKDKLSSLQSAYDKVITEHKRLEERNKILEDQNNNLNHSEKNLKKLLKDIENERDELDANLKRLSGTLSEMTGALECAKSENIKLDKKSAMLTIEIAELKDIIENYKKEQHTKQVDTDLHRDLQSKCNELSTQLSQIEAQNAQLRQSNETLEMQSKEVSSDNSKLVGEINSLTVRFNGLQKEHDVLKKQAIHMQLTSDQLRIEKENLEKENLNTVASLKELELRRTEMLQSKKSSQAGRIKELENCLEQKADCINTLTEQLQNLKLQQSEQTKQLTDKSETHNGLKKKLDETELLYTQEKQLNEDLQKDIAIFKAKLIKTRQLNEEKEKIWQNERNRFVSESKKAEERIRENRLELEGKLDKMKAKMKSIYNEEVSKIRNRHEMEVCDLRKDIHALSVKNEKYEVHIQKLSKRTYQLSETVLDLQKEIKFLETKLKDYESYSSTFRRPHHQPSSQVLGPELRMEDEEGEIFNNTYLTDLQTGRVSPFGRDSVSLQELQYRNSLAPPHLRSTYSAQYMDQHLREEDIKDGLPSNLDDSLSSLLHAGQKKKLTGTTSYKRPGPPTPSKNAGRLSLGGCGDIHPREILKENNDTGIVNRKATPNKLKHFFTSRSRDENTPPRRRLSNIFKKK